MMQEVMYRLMMSHGIVLWALQAGSTDSCRFPSGWRAVASEGFPFAPEAAAEVCGNRGNQAAAPEALEPEAKRRRQETVPVVPVVPIKRETRSAELRCVMLVLAARTNFGLVLWGLAPSGRSSLRHRLIDLELYSGGSSEIQFRLAIRRP